MVCITSQMSIVKTSLIVLVLGLAGPVAAQPLDATVQTSLGAAVKLSTLWGMPVVLFYEDKDGASQNQPLRFALSTQRQPRTLTEVVKVVAVANVEGYDWFPVKNFVLSSVRDAERASGIPVYLDWQGALQRKPWALSGKGSSVVVLDGKGRSIFSKNGALSHEEIAEVVSLLVRLASQ